MDERIVGENIPNRESELEEHSLTEWERSRDVLLHAEQLASVSIEMPRGHKPFYKASFEGGVSGVFKSEDYEPYLAEQNVPMDMETMHYRERAAYIVDEALGFGLVPPTVIRELEVEGEDDLKVGSLQLFLEHAHHFHTKDEETRKELLHLYEERIVTMALLDFIIWNEDRNFANVLIDYEKGEFYAIDNGTSFESRNEPVYFYDHSDQDKQMSFDGKVLPLPAVQSIRSLYGDIERMEALKAELFKCFNAQEVFPCLERIEMLALAFESDEFREFGMLSDTTRLAFERLIMTDKWTESAMRESMLLDKLM